MRTAVFVSMRLSMRPTRKTRSTLKSWFTCKAMINETQRVNNQH